MSETFKSNLSLREIPLKRVLKTYIVANVIRKYITMGIRVLWKEEMNPQILSRRIQLEKILKEIREIVMFIDCVTAMQESKHQTKAGIAFWLVFDGPECIYERFENIICKKFLEAGVEIESVKSVKGRGMTLFIYTLT